MVASWDMDKLSLAIWRGDDTDWDKCREGYPPGVFLELTYKEGEQSRDLAVWADDTSEGLFHYRDWTNDGIPFLDDGETYWSMFTFQKRKDALEFAKRTRGIGTWNEQYPEWVKRCNNRRDRRGQQVQRESEEG